MAGACIPRTRTVRLLPAFLVGVLAACAAPMGPEATGVERFEKDYADALANDASGRLTYGSCKDSELDLEALAATRGVGIDEIRHDFSEAVRLSAFRKVAAIHVTLKFLRQGDAYEPMVLPVAYTELPNFAEYFNHVERLNLTLEVQQEMLDMQVPDAHGDRTFTELHERLSALRADRTEIEVDPPDLDPELLAHRIADLDGQILSVQTLMEAADPDRMERRRLYQNQLKAAAFEIAVLRAFDSFFTAPALISGPVWPDGLDAENYISTPERLEQLYARYPILAIGDSWLFVGSDLAERIAAEDLGADADAWADALVRHALDQSAVLPHRQRDWSRAVEGARNYVETMLPAEIQRIAESDFDARVQARIDEAIQNWQAKLDEELKRLPGRDAEGLLAYVDLVDDALVSASESEAELWLADWCASAERHRWFEIGKVVTYMGASVGAIIATAFGQVEVAVPLATFVATAFVADAIASTVKAAQGSDAQSLFWLSHEEFSEQERRALLELVLSGAGVGAEAFLAVRMVQGWKMFQRVKWRLDRMSREFEAAEAQVTTLRLQVEAAKDAGFDVRVMEDELFVAVRILAAVDEPSRIAGRTLEAVRAAESGMGRMEVAYLSQQFRNETEAVAFFERLGRDQQGWDMMARAGYREWLRSVREAQRDGRHVPVPEVCR